ncbi:MAG TPA: serine hydrolase [Gaiellaceae bacterium]|nr:serine hydrolase [Gaiellaceae bacterium]
MHSTLPAAAPPRLAPPALVVPAPREVSFGRVAGRVAPGTRRILIRVDGRLVAVKQVRRRRFALVVSLPRRDVTLRVTAVDRRGRRSSTVVGPVFGLPRHAAPYGPAPPLRGYEDPALARTVHRLAHRFHGTCAVFVEDLRTGAGAAWNARARFPAASTLKVAIAIELLRSSRGAFARGTASGSLLWRMLVYSDNRAANELLVRIGGSISAGAARVNQTMRELRLADTEMYGGYEGDSIGRRPIPLEIVSSPTFVGKYTTAWDLARLGRYLHLATIGKGALVRRFRGAFTRADARHLLYVLAHVREPGRLERYLTGGGVAVLHKGGWIEKARHDSGLVYWRGGAFAVTVLTWNAAGAGNSSDVLAGRVARAALERFRETAAGG